MRKGTFTFYNASGFLIKTMPTEVASKLQLSTDDWLPGIYTVIYKSEKMVASGRFVKH